VNIEVAYVGPEGAFVVALALREGACVSDAVAASGLVERLALFEAALAYGIHGQRASERTPLVEGDRVELLRPLKADPKDARRRRAEARPLPRTPGKPPRTRR
jgi:putative ubiquitin-RnfH superfamily antitoxin RatB of RatAB toxin-antitoxin module